MCSSFWKNAAASLPPQVRRRYAAEFAAAERFEAVLDFVIEAGSFARRALGRGCESVAAGLRKTARILDVVARHLALTH
jgi:hypothetical protein